MLSKRCLISLPKALSSSLDLVGFLIETPLEVFEAWLNLVPGVLGVHAGKVELHPNLVCGPLEVIASVFQVLFQCLVCFISAHGLLL